MSGADEELIGVISDTHGLLRPEAAAALAGCSRIIHAGDIDDPRVLQELELIAPVQAVRGNMDRGDWAEKLPETTVVQTDACSFYVIHDISRLDLDPAAAGLHAVIYGHSHQPVLERRADVIYLNPGSAGPRRFKLPVSLARMRVAGENIEAELIILQPGS